MPPAPLAPTVRAPSEDTNDKNDDSRETRSSYPSSSPLAGHAIWYGRVEPRHVEGILRETVLGGRVIKELVRGVVDFNGTGGSGDDSISRARMVYI
jgi:(2Fe-2S) ferredoxin